MVEANGAVRLDQKNIHVVSARLCSGCGKYFLHDHGYTLDPNRKGPDGGPAVFHRRCYKGPATPVIGEEALAKMDWKRLESMKATDDGSLIYCFEKQISVELAHDGRKMKDDE